MADSRLAQLMKHDDAVRKHEESAGQEVANEHPLLGMQKAVGNAAVARMLAQREESAEMEEEEMQAKHDPSLQREAESGEAEEEEMQAKHDPSLQREAESGEAEEEEMQAKHDPSLQREAESGEAEEEELQAKHDDLAPVVGLEGGAVGDEISGTIAAARGSGSPLGGAVKDKMESSFGTSFDDVRVHSDKTSDSLNRQVTAKAFTTGSDIFLRSDSSPGDEKLLAHELTHVVQQRGMTGGGSGGMEVGAAGSSHEQEADAVATEVTSGNSVSREAEEKR